MRTVGSWLMATMIFALTPTMAPGQSLKDWPWNPLHMTRLPPEVRHAIGAMCGGQPHLGHYFATYSQNGRQINLHFEEFHCEGGGGFCRGELCLHQTWHRRDGHFVLVKSFYTSRNH
jgi:hypothetical protein